MTLLGRIGKYELKATIGEGTLGPMLLAEDTVLAREVAIKVLRASLSDKVREALGARIKREARAVAALSHPNVCTLHDLGEDPQFGVYAVFEYVRGVSLRRRLESGPLSLEETAQLAREVGSALAYAHESGTLHRDLKPENVLLARFGSQITDFGIGNIPDIEGMEAVASPYISPETVARSVYTARNDQYAFATLLFECLAGHLPKDEEELDAPEADARLSNRLGQLIARARSSHPEDRFPTCRDFGDAVASAIEAAQSGAPLVRLSLSGSNTIAPTEPTKLESAEVKVVQPPRGHNVIIGAALVILCGLILTRKPHNRVVDNVDGGLHADPAPTLAQPSLRPSSTPRAMGTQRSTQAAPAVSAKPVELDATAPPDVVPDDAP